VAELERFLGKTRPLYLQRDVASGALQQDGLAEVGDAWAKSFSAEPRVQELKRRQFNAWRAGGLAQ
jgi:hypothetical protein